MNLNFVNTLSIESITQGILSVICGLLYMSEIHSTYKQIGILQLFFVTLILLNEYVLRINIKNILNNLFVLKVHKNANFLNDKKNPQPLIHTRKILYDMFNREDVDKN